MDRTLEGSILEAWLRLPEGCRHPPADEEQLNQFESDFGPIPSDFRWFLSTCGGGVCGREWVDNIEELRESHRKFESESRPGGWTMRDVFIIGWDGFGNPYGIEQKSGKLLVEDHNFGGIHEMAESFSTFLVEGLGVRTQSDIGDLPEQP